MVVVYGLFFLIAYLQVLNHMKIECPNIFFSLIKKRRVSNFEVRNKIIYKDEIRYIKSELLLNFFVKEISCLFPKK